MAEKDQAFLKKLLQTFSAEAAEHIAVMGQRLAQLGRDGSPQGALVEEIFREAHTLKAAARAVSQTEMHDLCQAMESVFALFKRGEMTPAADTAEVMLRACDLLSDLLARAKDGVTPELRKRCTVMTGEVEALLTGAAATPATAAQHRDRVREPASPSPRAEPVAVTDAPGHRGGTRTRATPGMPDAEAQPAAMEIPMVRPDTVRLQVARLDSLLLQTEEMIAIKVAMQRQAQALRETALAVERWRKKGRQSAARASAPVDVMAETGDAEAAGFASRLTLISRDAAQQARSFSSMVDSLLTEIKQVLMLPCSHLLEPFPKIVRDLARDQRKQIELQISGADMEIDRRILDDLREPLLHIVRNCVDHGIETPESRKRAGKAERGVIRMDIRPQENDQVEIVVADDGAGIALDKVRAASRKLGLTVPDAGDSKEGIAEQINLIFQSGVSTSPMLTDVSGRGLGLAIVKEKIENLGGHISVESTPGKGITFRLCIPVTLATFRGTLLSVGERMLVLPTLNVDRMVRYSRTDLRSVENAMTLTVGGKAVPFVKMADVLGMEPETRVHAGEKKTPAVVLGTGNQRVAFAVSDVHGDQEVLVKKFGWPVKRVRNVSGVTILGDGRLAPILNAHDLLKSAALAAPAMANAAAKAEGKAARQKKRILVVEDSITARGLLKNILETAGYEVGTAVDGVEAWTSLKLNPCDLVVSDVEMPRMNGFDLTSRIRHDRTLGELPVVLVTALSSREDRERGVDAGANAYIVKGDFEQNNLLEAVRRLL